MKTLLNYLPLLAIAGLFALGSPEKQPSVVESVASAPSPACDCNPCKCVVCKCEPTPDVAQVTPDIAVVSGVPVVAQGVADTRPTITPAEAKAVEQVAFTQPQILPVKPLLPPQVLPVKPKAVPVTGHYEYRQQCNGRSCQVVRVWVPHIQGTAAQARTIKVTPTYQQPVYYQQPQRGWFRGRGCGPGGCR
jgi:hypothetical protein